MKMTGSCTNFWKTTPVKILNVSPEYVTIIRSVRLAGLAYASIEQVWRNNMVKADTAVIGGGAAGLMAAIAAAKNGAKTVIIEHMDRVGKKILSTGNGKCNYTNALCEISCYRGEHPDFVSAVLKQFGSADTIRFFEELGVCPKERNGWYYPQSGQASAVLDVLMMETKAAGVTIYTSCRICSIKKKGGCFWVDTNQDTFLARTVVFATGLLASPKTGSDGSALPYIEQFGHKMIDIVPALVQMKGKQSFLKSVAGIRAEAAVTLFVNGQQITTEKGELQLTEYGVSGIPVFQLSRYAAKALSQGGSAYVLLDFLPQLQTMEETERFLSRRFFCAAENGRGKDACAALVGLFHKKLIPVFLREADIPAACWAGNITRKQVSRLSNAVRALRVDLTGSMGFSHAQVCAGGVDTSQIKNDTLESKLVEGLYFAGEVIDIDGACGGYNLQWAWSSGYVAGCFAARHKVREDVQEKICIRQIGLPIGHTKKQLDEKIQKTLKLPSSEEFRYTIVKRSIDARKKPDLKYVYTVEASLSDPQKHIKKIKDRNVSLVTPKRYQIKKAEKDLFHRPPVIVGTGPAGLFCAYALLLGGIRPILIERGKPAEERVMDIERFWKSGVLDTRSNVQFGEGGAGTFSDGKLNTLVKDPLGRSRFVLETFVKFGAPESILYENKPHIGTDLLLLILKNMRIEMERMGAEYRFLSCMTDYRIEHGRLGAIEINEQEWLETSCMALAIGHSARDTFFMLAQKGDLFMEAKAFAVGYRVEHPQMSVNFGQYGERYFKELPAASYKLAANFENGRGVYSFCMCPGGYVVNASSEEGKLVVNGMSYSARDGANANSAIIVTVTPDDFRTCCDRCLQEKKEIGNENDALCGVRFQQKLEERAFSLCNGKIPQQLFGDYCDHAVSSSYGAFESAAKGACALTSLRGLLPDEVEQTFIRGMHQFAHEVHDFDRRDAILSGIESRTSSPIRIRRNQNFMSDVEGIYPCGEGAGYAGGIMSAAMDGLKTAEAIMKNNRN